MGDVFALVRIFASESNVFVHATDLSGKETIARVTVGMSVKQERGEGKNHNKKRKTYNAMLAAQDVAKKCKEIGITAMNIKLRATGGYKKKVSRYRSPGCSKNSGSFWLKDRSN